MWDCSYYQYSPYLVTPNNVISDYYKYGPKYEKNLIDTDLDINEGGNSLIEYTAEETGSSFDTAKIIVILSVVLAVCLIIDDLTKGKEKKK